MQRGREDSWSINSSREEEEMEGVCGDMDYESGGWTWKS